MTDNCTHKDHPHEIENIYKETCGDWKYWNPWHPPPEDSLIGKVCKSCDYCRRDED